MAWDFIKTSVSNLRDFDRFVALYSPGIISFCRRKELREHDAEDICQEVLVKLFQALPTFVYDPQKRFRGWLANVVRNAIRDFLDKPNRRLDSPGGSEALKRLQAIADSDADDANDFSDDLVPPLWPNVQVSEAYRTAQARHPKGCDVVERMYGLGNYAHKPEMTIKEAADELGMTVAAASMARMRFLRAFKEEMERLQAFGP